MKVRLAFAVKRLAWVLILIGLIRRRMLVMCVMRPSRNGVGPDAGRSRIARLVWGMADPRFNPVAMALHGNEQLQQLVAEKPTYGAAFARCSATQ